MSTVFRSTAGVEMLVETTGPADAPVVLLLHGYPLDGRMWRAQVAALGGTHFVVVPDLPGFGGSPMPEHQLAMDELADAVADLIEHVAPGRSVTAVGFSMGSYLALRLAITHPSKLGGLVLVGGKATADSDEAREKRAIDIALAQSAGAEAIAQKMLPTMLAELTRNARPDLADEVSGWMSAQSVDAIVHGLRLMRDRPDSTGELGAIRLPALVLVGGEDPAVPLDVADQLAAALGPDGARLVVVPNEAHLIPPSWPEQVNQALVAFLDGHGL